MSERLPYTKGYPEQGYFSKYSGSNLNSGNTMYYNGDFMCARTFNAVWNDYAEKFSTEQEIKPGELLIYNENGINLFIGICTKKYGRCLGKGNVAICMTGRVPLKIKTNKLKGGEFLYWNGNKVGIVKEWNQVTIANKIGKVIKIIDENTAIILV